MSKIRINKSILAVIIAIIGLALGALLGVGVEVATSPDKETGETNVKITLSFDQAKPAVITEEDGTETEADVPVVDEVDGGQIKEGVEPAQGAWFPTDTPTAFKDATIGRCADIDGFFGSQCVDLFQAFFNSYTGGRWASACGKGSARGLWDCRDRNAGDDFELITDVDQLQAGDWVVFNGGVFGHVGMALGPANGGYVALLGQNQGGLACAGGGAAANIINMSTRTFLGAFRPKAYIVPVPEPEPAPEPETPAEPKTITYTYVPGDYFSAVLVKLGLDEGDLWGEDGTVAYYTKQLVDQNMLELGNTGNVRVGVPFTLTSRAAK